MKTNYTPGPWGIKVTETGPLSIFSGKTGSWLAVTCMKQWKTEDRFNALLMAAAPEMLISLKAVLELTPDHPCRNRIKDAIKKAEGE